MTQFAARFNRFSPPLLPEFSMDGGALPR